MLIAIENLSKYYGATRILDTINLVVENQDRIGLIGVNGAGKSTLLNIISGEMDYDTGFRHTATNLHIGFLKQTSGLNTEYTIQEELQSVFKEVNNTLERMNVLEEKMSKISVHEGDEFQSLLAEYNQCQAIVDAKDGYQVDVKINRILQGMGFGNKDKNTAIATLSGGEKTRLALCKLLLEEPELLILDEPTNHLDFKTLLWLEEYLKNYKGALLLVSHDRFFLDSLVTSVCEIEYGKLTRYVGNYSHFAQQKQEHLTRQLKLYEEQQAEKKRLEEYVAKNIARATSSSSAKSKRKAIEHMELVDKPLPPPKTAKMAFQYTQEPVKDVLHIENVSLSVGKDNKKKLMQNFSLDVFRGEKVAIIGENGIGKSSLLKAIQELIPIDGGNVEWGRNVKIAYFDQEDGGLDFSKTALMELWDRYPSLYEHTIRTTLGNVLITQEESFKLVSSLSGGERAKLKFAIMILEQGNVLILDEPSNHLDLQSKEILDKALCNFTGTLIMVSHDRYLLSKVPTKIVEISQDGKKEYKGNYYNYLEQNKKELPSDSETTTKPQEDIPNKAIYNRSKEMRSATAALRREKSQLETEIAELEQKILELEGFLSDPQNAVEYEKLHLACEELEQSRHRLDVCYERWVDLSEQV